MIALLGWFLTPIGKWVGIALVASVLIGSVVLKIQRDAAAMERAKIEQENSNAIDKAREARDSLRAACDRAPDDCVPDDNFRD